MATILPSIYRAKATQYNGGRLTALVPQVFGEATVEVTDFVGPPKLGMGWIFFQGGNPEFPVWSSGLGVGASNGDLPPDYSEEFADLEATDIALDSRLDVLEAADIALDGRLDGLESETVAPGNALGIVAVGSLLGPAPLTIAASTSAPITMPLVFTSQVGRRYRIVTRVRAMHPTSSGVASGIRFETTGGGLTADTHVAVDIPFESLEHVVLFDGTGVEGTYVTSIFTAATTGQYVYTNQLSSFFYIEDVGPNIYPALPIPSTPPPWTPLTPLNGWSAILPFKIRVVGDVVQMQGSVAHASTPAAAGAIAVVPPQARPLNEQPLNVAYYYGNAPSTYFVTSLSVRTNGDLWYDGVKSQQVHWMITKDQWYTT